MSLSQFLTLSSKGSSERSLWEISFEVYIEKNKIFDLPHTEIFSSGISVKLKISRLLFSLKTKRQTTLMRRFWNLVFYVTIKLSILNSLHL